MLKKTSEYQDSLALQKDEGTLQDKLISIHEVITATFSFVDRISVAVYEQETDLLKIFMASCYGETPLNHHEVMLNDLPLLMSVMNKGKASVIDDVDIFSKDNNIHILQMAELRYVASYVMPVYKNAEFFGFIIFNSGQPNVFEENALHQMDLFGHMISLMVMNELTVAYAGNKKLTDSHVMDLETGSYIDRMSRYAQLIAGQLAEQYSLADDYIKHIGLFSPLHDIGKGEIPDSILQKKGKLTVQEFELVKTHASKGRDMVDQLLNNFSRDSFRHASILRNIAQYHHEFMNGSGYPHGLKGDEIPLEARIVAVADIFDALTSERSYRKAWSNDVAFAMLKDMAGGQLDEDCVTGLISNVESIENIQETHSENHLG
ncbi:MAG: HD domain-containing protein [Gammaproteobacteria bacterium]|nr:HD domain-containing protein [Gammaproteobacteria bacterium]